jgi:hypothetical protein
MLTVLTLSVSATDFGPRQAELGKLHDSVSVTDTSISELEADNSHVVKLRYGLVSFANAVIKTQHQRASRTTEKETIGWREHIALPDFGSTELGAKIDTGARTSALHAVDLQVEKLDGEEWVSFHLPYLGEARTVRHSAKIIDKRKIKNTSGIAQVRYVINTTLVLGTRQWQIEVSLADREKMKHDIILGRTAVRHRGLLVEPGKSYLAGPPVTAPSGTP